MFAHPSPDVNGGTTQVAQSLLTVEILSDIIEAATAKAAALVMSQGQGGPVMRKAWVYTRGDAYYVGFRDPDGRRHGKSCGTGPKGKRLAEREADRLHAELVTGTYQSNAKKTWCEFRAEYEAKILPAKAPATQQLTRRSLNNFERLAKPGRVSGITTKTIDTFIAARRVEVQAFRPRTTGKRKSPKPYAERKQVKPRTVNADLRSIQTALNVAAEWGYLKELPKFRFLPQPEALPKYITPEDFDRLYEACAVAVRPVVQGIDPAEWWRALLTVGYMTGLRIGELLSLARDKVALPIGVAQLWNQKASREEAVPLHPVAVAALERMRGFSPVFFPWPHHRNLIWKTFHRIQAAAGIPGKYTPHALRRAFGTLNANRVGGPKALQFLMRHKDGRTTQQFYVNPMEGLTEAVDRLFVPPKLRTGTG